MKKKYFIAIILAHPYLEIAESIKHELFLSHGLKGALRCPAHITLHRPFEWKEEKEKELIETLERFRFSEKFRIELENYNCFEPRVLYIHVKRNDLLNKIHEELTRFAKTELRLFNEAEDMRGFHPHVTIAFRDLKKPLFYSLWAQFKEKKISGSFEYGGFCLLKLGSKWEILRQFDI